MRQWYEINCSSWRVQQSARLLLFTHRMASLTKTDINAIEQAVAYPRGFGYVLDFSDKTMGEFFEDEFGIDIYSEEYLVNGSSKRNCLSTLLKSKESEFSLRVLRGLC